jgi:hypothetical protein
LAKEAVMGMTLAEAHVQGFEVAGRHTARFVAYIRELAEDEATLPVPGLAWTVGQTVTHVQSVYERYTLDRRRAETADLVAVVNAEDVARIGVGLDRSAGSIEEQWELLGQLVGAVSPESEFPFHAGLRTTMAGGWGNLVGELLAHGDDLARATGRPFGVPGEDLEVTWRFGIPLLSAWLTPGARALVETWRLAMPFGDLGLVFDRGDLSVVDDPVDADHVLQVGDVEELTLRVPYRRRVPGDPLVGLLGARFRDV